MDPHDGLNTTADDASDELSASLSQDEPAAGDPEAEPPAGRRSRRRRAVAPLIGLALVLALIGVSLPKAASVVHQRDSLRRQDASMSLAAQALAADPGDTPLAARLALAAYRVSPTPEAIAALAHVSQDNAPVTRVMQADAHPIMTSAQDANGTDLFTDSDDGVLRRWDMTSGRLLAHTTSASPVEVLAADPSGAKLLGVDENLNMLVWDTGNRNGFAPPTTVVDTIEGVTPQTSALAAGFYDAGTKVYAVLHDGTIMTASLADSSDQHRETIGTALAHAGISPLPAQSDIVAAETGPFKAAGGKADSRIMLATVDNRIVSLDLDTDAAAAVLGGAAFPGSIHDIAVDPRSEGTELAVVSGGGVGLWAVSSGTSLGSVQGLTHSAASVDFDTAQMPDGSDHLVIGSDSGAAIVPVPPATAAEDSLNASLTVPHGGSLQTFSPPVPGGPGTLLAVTDDTGAVTVVDSGTERRELPRTAPSTVMAFDGHGDLLLNSVDEENRTQGLYSIKPSTTQSSKDYATVQSYLPPAAWWPQGGTFYVNNAILDDRFAAAAGQDPGRKGAVLVWDAKTGTPVKYLTLPGGTQSNNAGIPNFALTVQDDPALNLLVARDNDGRVIAWSTTTWQQTMLISTGASGGDLALSPDGTTAAVDLAFGDPKASGSDRKSALGFIDLRTRRLTQDPEQSLPYRIRYSPRGDQLAEVTTSGTLRLLTASGTPETEDIRLPSYAAGLAYSPGGDRVAVVLNDSETALYDTATGARVDEDLPGQYADTTEGAVWSPSGTVLAIDTGQRTTDYTQAEGVELWDMNPADWAAGMCTLAAGTGLTPVEWKRYTGGAVPFIKLC